MAQLVNCLTLDFNPRHDLTVGEIEPRIQPCADRVEPAWDSPSFSLCFSQTCEHAHSLSLSPSLQINEHLKTNKNFFKKDKAAKDPENEESWDVFKKDNDLVRALF